LNSAASTPWILLDGLALVFLSLPLPAQTVGGDLAQRFRFDGFSQGEELGYAVSSAGDVDQDGFDDLIVGAPFARPDGFSETGIADLYSGRTGNLIRQFDGFLTFDQMGASVSGGRDVDGDGVPDLLVGSPHANPNGLYDAGSVFLFSGATGMTIHRFGGAEKDDLFGNSVAFAGDMDGDGVAELIIGAHGTTVQGDSLAGSAFVFSGRSGALLHRFDGSSTNRGVGRVVAGAGDVDGDGFADLILGVPGSSPPGNPSVGSVFLYSGATGNLIRRLNGPAKSDSFGISVAGTEDVDGDGVPDLIVGAPALKVKGLASAGAVFLYSGATGNLILRIDGTMDNGALGSSVAGLGDFDGDGIPDLAAGAPHSSPDGIPGAGSAFVFSGATGSQLFRFDGRESSDGFGFAVSCAGDVNADGRADMILGAPFAHPVSYLETGSALVFTFNPILEASAEELSVASGGTIDYAIDFSGKEAFSSYAVLLSLGGTGPTGLRGLAVPLTRDRFFLASLKGHTPPQARGFQGRLDALGRASARFSALPGGLPAKLAGRTLYLSAVDKRLDLASVARKLVFLP